MLPKSRLEGLTDGIFAVTMTLLVLDLKFTEGPLGQRTVFDDLARLVDRIDNYVISFVVLALFWIAHVRMLSRTRELDAPFVVLNLAFLLFTTAVPPLTTLLGNHPALPRAAVLYGANLLLILICEALAWHRVCHRLANETLADGPSTWRLSRQRHYFAIGVVLLGIAIALIEIRIGASQGLATWIYLLLIGAGLYRPTIALADR
jgi:uncharacterized membrane protein